MLDKVNLWDRLGEIVRPYAPGLPEGADAHAAGLRDAGLTSLAAVRLMLDVEAAFALAIPDRDLTPENFHSIASVAALVERLRQN